MVAKTNGKAKKVTAGSEFWVVGSCVTDVERREEGYEYYTIEVVELNILDISTGMLCYEVVWKRRETGEIVRRNTYTVGGQFVIEWEGNV